MEMNVDNTKVMRISRQTSRNNYVKPKTTGECGKF
jgi:hypothetical protein